MPSRLLRNTGITVLLLAVGSALAQQKTPPQHPDNRNTEIEESHDTPPRHMPGPPGARSDARNMPGAARAPDTRGLNIDEAHDTPPDTARSASTRGQKIDEAHRTSPQDSAAGRLRGR